MQNPKEPLSYDRLKRYLVQAGIIGAHQSHTRHDNVEKARLLSSGDPDITFGIASTALATPDDALQAMAQVTGAAPGEAYIAPEALFLGLARAGRRLSAVCAAGGSMIIATGHPAGLLPAYMYVARLVSECGARLLRPLENAELPGPGGRRVLKYLGGVAVLSDWGSLLHTHSPAPMEHMLSAQGKVDLVLADHGFSGAAFERAVPAIAVVDSNDHALALAAQGRADPSYGSSTRVSAQGRSSDDLICLPMDDNRAPDVYTQIVSFAAAQVKSPELQA